MARICRSARAESSRREFVDGEAARTFEAIHALSGYET
jgi:hypothetical protein